MKNINKHVVVAAVAAFAVAFFIASNQGNLIFPNPFVPQRPDRPVLQFLAKAAKTFLWVAMFAERKPPTPDCRVVQSPIGPNGHEFLNHAEGF